MVHSYILSIDQGTSSSKAIIFDAEGRIVCKGAESLRSYYSHDNYVEQQPLEIYENVLQATEKCLQQFRSLGHSENDIQACGISNQRETFVLWDERGRPLYNAVVWQCKRSVEICTELSQRGLAETIKSKTGLLIDPYFSASKLIWLYRNEESVREAINRGQAYFGTIDTWLLYKLSDGKHYQTDYTNASRTMFFNLASLSWDEELLQEFELSNLKLPEVKPSAYHYGESDFNGLLKRTVPICSLIGDSHAAAFGEGCFEEGSAKATLGTGCSILMNTGGQIRESDKGMVSTICWSTEDRIDYALEGVIVTCGATIEWLKNELGLFADSKETEAMARAVADNNGVYLVPAFCGLGAPWWDMSRRASISGLTFGSNKNHIVRAALESIPYQIKDVVAAMEATGIQLRALSVNGGISSNSFVLQFLADLLNRPLNHIGIGDVSAYGAAGLAGLKAGLFRNLAHLKSISRRGQTLPGAEQESVRRAYEGWQAALISS